MTPDDPRHGSMSGYNQHIKDGELGDQACFPCRVAASQYRQTTRRLSAYGQWQPFVDAEPARQHVKWLMSEGMPLKEIAAAVGAHTSRVARLIYGKGGQPLTQTRLIYGKGGQPLTQTRPDFAAAVLELRPVTTRVSSLGAARRIQALVAQGHSTGVIAERLGITYARVGQIIHRRDPEMFRDTHDRIAALYDELHMAEPARTTRSDRQRTSRALTAARQHGWAPPAAWDNIDDPAARPQGVVPRSRRKGGIRQSVDPARVERVLAGEWGRGHNCTVAERREIAKRWHLNGGSMNELAKLTGWRPDRYFKVGDAA